ncbi:constitutive coactivator of peroxisome proliferator-activated receptor gamma [Aulostomus maculatus]
MGVKGLQYFMDRCCPEACVTVNLREMARRQVARTPDNTTSATLVVDGMACLCHWYTCRDWVCGGQWREYMDSLKNWVETFTSAGIRLVFFFDGVIEEQKRQEWVKRRCRVNGEISKIFQYIKVHGEQPRGDRVCIPSGLATFTCFALRLLGQEVFCSVREADYEIAAYARRQGCMGILGQDSDFIIHDSAPYLSVAKLHISSLTTVLYDRQRLCGAIGLAVTQLPLLACLLGNDVVSEERMHHIRNEAMATHRKKHPSPQSRAPQGQMVLAVSEFVSNLWCGEEEETEYIPQSLSLSAPDRKLMEKGIFSYLLPGQEAPQQDAPPSHSAFENYISPAILKVCREKHVAAEDFMVYGVVCEGVLECSNSLEDEEENELLPQALVYRPCRQHIYSLLLPNKHDGSSEEPPAIKEWFVYPGNPLKQPDLVQPVPISLPCDQPSLDLLWLGSGPEVSALRLTCFLSIFDCQEFSQLYEVIDDSLLAAVCLVTYIVLQVPTLSSEDMDAYLSQAVCLKLKSPQELQQIKLPFLSSRAVQLGSLYVRGLSHLLGANCASGCPLPRAALMPWHSFDGRLFHSKYLLAHSGTQETVLLDGDSSCLSLFLQLKENVTEACRRRNRVLQSRPRPGAPEQRTKQEPSDKHTGGPRDFSGDWRERGGHQQGGGWSNRDEARREQSESKNLEKQWERQRGHFHPHSYPHCNEVGLQGMSSPPKQSRGRSRHCRGRFQLAPRWSQPPAPGP